MELFNQTGEVIQQASRRGAEMAMLSIDHPDIIRFILSKYVPDDRNTRILDEYGIDSGHLSKILTDNQLTHMNISVVITDKFMEAVRDNKEWFFISPSSKSIVGRMEARELFQLLAKTAWGSGDPG